MNYLGNISVDSAIEKVMSSSLPIGTPNNFFFGDIPLYKENFLLYKRTHRRISPFGVWKPFSTKFFIASSPHHGRSSSESEIDSTV